MLPVIFSSWEQEPDPRSTPRVFQPQNTEDPFPWRYRKMLLLHCHDFTTMNHSRVTILHHHQTAHQMAPEWNPLSPLHGRRRRRFLGGVEGLVGKQEGLPPPSHQDDLTQPSGLWWCQVFPVGQRSSE